MGKARRGNWIPARTSARPSTTRCASHSIFNNNQNPKTMAKRRQDTRCRPPYRRCVTTIAMSAAILLVEAIFWSKGVEAVPYMLLTSSRETCVTVDAPGDTVLSIQYSAPDIILVNDLEAEIQRDEQKYHIDHPKDSEPGKQQYNSGQDKLYYERHKKKMEMITKKQNRNSADMTVTVSQKRNPALGARISGGARAWRDPRQRGRGNDVRINLEQHEGSISFETHFDGPVEVCAQSINANLSAPSRVGFSITLDVGGPEEVVQKNAEKELGRMESNIRDLMKKIDLILSQADYSKQQEVRFHELSLAMNRASMWWPIVQLLVLLLTAITQINHMVRFFKTRHIF